VKKVSRYLFSLLTVLFLITGLLVASAAPVFAIADPDSPPQVSAVYVYEFDDGSIGVLVDYYLDYSSIPSETVTEAYLAVFVDTDGTTQLKAVAPYTFVNSGYGRGLVWIPFTADEVTAYGITSASVADYRIWLIGNPTLSWAGDPPKTIAGIDQWNDTGDISVLLALRVLYYADVLELAWSLDMVEATALGNRLTATGESYFVNVIPNLRILAPACFSSGTQEPSLEDIDYSISFGGTVTSGTATIDGSPVTLSEGSNTIAATSTGTFTIELNNGTYGTIENGTGTISNSPSDIVPGENEITVTATGTLIIDVALQSPQQAITETVEGTGFDLTTVAARFGMSRIMFSGILWTLITIVICAAVYGWRARSGAPAQGVGSVLMLVLGVSLVGGTLLGMLDMRVVAVLAIGYGALIGYVLFFRTSADIGRTVMFMGWMWFVVCLVGGTLAGITPQAGTYLTADITDSDTTITVASTNGFRDSGIIVIGDERIAYYKTTATTFEGTFWRPLVRGAQDTEAVAHSSGDTVRAPESSLLNDALNYNIALLSDASGLMAFVSVPLAIWDLLTSFIFLPLEFLGTDMVILTYIWAIIGLGLLVSFFVALAGGRRV